MRTIAHISDLHFGRHAPAVVAALASDIEKLRPSLIVASGDFTQRARTWQFQAAADFLHVLSPPCLCVPGNHDIPMFDILRRIFRPLERYRAFISDRPCPVFRDEELLVAGINTARRFSFTWDGFWKDGRISTSQLAEARRQISEVPHNLFKVVVTHHPFIPPPGQRMKGIVLKAGRALDQFEQCGVDMLLAGHLHLPYSGDVRGHHETVRRSILSVQAGTAVSTRRRGEPNAYNLITIDGQHVAIDVRTHGARGFETSTINRFERHEGVWHQSPATN